MMIFTKLIGILKKKAMMKQFFGSQFSLNDETWYKLSLRWGLFFLFLTIVNEISWRFLETDDWVFIKVFVFKIPIIEKLGLTLSSMIGCFTVLLLLFLLSFKISGKLSNTDYIMENTFWIGVFPGLDEEELSYVVKIIKSCF